MSAYRYCAEWVEALPEGGADWNDNAWKSAQTAQVDQFRGGCLHSERELIVGNSGVQPAVAGPRLAMPPVPVVLIAG